ncbi:MAG: hypothetical protein LBL83_11445 [Clostridiales bacterium]|nr:hypothetical protein [Clostridiales bacterium]
MEAYFVKGVPNGQATIVQEGYSYIGNLSYGVITGEGTLTAPSGDQYTGSFREGSFNGQGRLTFTDGSYYEGEFRDDELYNGYGYGYDAYGNFGILETWVDGSLMN